MRLVDEKQRIAVASEAVKYVEEGMILGVGSGRAVVKFIGCLASKIREEKLKVNVVAASNQTENLCIKNNIPVTSLIENPTLDLDVDGSDQVEKDTLHMIKGGGAALLREKIVASAARKLIIIVEESKLADKLSCSVPLEVLPFALGFCLKKLKYMGTPLLRKDSKTHKPLITDNSNYIIDLDMGVIDNPYEVEAQLNTIPGILETGLFLNLADTVIIGLKNNKVKTLTKTKG